MSALQFSSTLTHLAETRGPPRYRCLLRRGFREQWACVKRRPAICLHNHLLINSIMKHRFPAKHSWGHSRMTSPSEKQLLAASFFFFTPQMIVVNTIRSHVLLTKSSLVLVSCNCDQQKWLCMSEWMANVIFCFRDPWFYSHKGSVGPKMLITQVTSETTCWLVLWY